MPYYALFYDTVDNFVEQRQPFRSAHLAKVDAAHGDGSLVLAGALKPSGALLVFHADDPAVAERFAETDPYVKNGLVTDWRVREWSVVIGDRAVAR
jgi:uncharacterized protein YciI